MSQPPSPHAPRPDASPAPEGETADALFARAGARGREKGLGYHGELTPAEAWALHTAGAARLIDVRTFAEWTYVGHVEGAPLVEWRTFGAQQPNPGFIAALAEQVPQDMPVMFLCRSAVRSHSAAELAARSGWRLAMNVLEGFEGDLDASGHRGTRGGWRRAGLPWIQT
jgi:rhodanese-related sulfurtransferase